MLIEPLVMKFVMVLGLGLFFGLAFEEFYQRRGEVRPGGVRTFPLLALTGGLLYRLDPAHLVPLTGGLVVLGAWLAVYYARHVEERDVLGRANVGIVVLVCNVLAFLLGPVTLAEPPWVAVGATVATVLLLAARTRLHDFARRLEADEIVTAVKFLILTGLILPLLPDQPVTQLTEISPRQVWFAVVAVCSLSYASYLMQRYVAPRRGSLWVAILGGLYSSTATTIVLARRAAAAPDPAREPQSGIIIACSVMYLRLLAIVGIFNLPLAATLATPMIGLAVIGLGLAAAVRRRAVGEGAVADASPPANPLELTAAFIFAVLFVVISVAAGWVKAQFGLRGVYVLAALVGVSDIDPFVLSLAQGGTPAVPVVAGAVAILVAASSNSVLKAGYTAAFAGRRKSLVPGLALLLLAALGIGVALWMDAGA